MMTQMRWSNRFRIAGVVSLLMAVGVAGIGQAAEAAPAGTGGCECESGAGGHQDKARRY